MAAAAVAVITPVQLTVDALFIGQEVKNLQPALAA
jgi:hypothetical protein